MQNTLTLTPKPPQISFHLASGSKFLKLQSLLLELEEYLWITTLSSYSEYRIDGKLYKELEILASFQAELGWEIWLQLSFPWAPLKNCMPYYRGVRVCPTQFTTEREADCKEMSLEAGRTEQRREAPQSLPCCNPVVLKVWSLGWLYQWEPPGDSLKWKLMGPFSDL